MNISIIIYTNKSIKLVVYTYKFHNITPSNRGFLLKSTYYLLLKNHDSLIKNQNEHSRYTHL